MCEMPAKAGSRIKVLQTVIARLTMNRGADSAMLHSITELFDCPVAHLSKQSSPSHNNIR